MNNLKYGLIFICSLLCTAAFADKQLPSNYPPDCKPVGFHFKDKNIILKGPLSSTNQAVYLLNNVAPSSYFFSRSITQPGASAGWNTKIDPAKWAVLVINKKNSAWSCQSAVPGNNELFSCKSVLKVCQYKGKVNQQSLSAVWPIENSPLADVLNKLK